MVVRSSARAPLPSLVKGLVVAGLRAGQMETKQELPGRPEAPPRLFSQLFRRDRAQRSSIDILTR